MLKILAICGNGQGSSIMLRLGMEPALDDLGIRDASIECTALGQAQGLIPFADLIIIAAHLADLVELPEDKPVVVVKNLINKEEVRVKVEAALKQYYPELLKQ